MIFVASKSLFQSGFIKCHFLIDTFVAKTNLNI